MTTIAYPTEMYILLKAVSEETRIEYPFKTKQENHQKTETDEMTTVPNRNIRQKEDPPRKLKGMRNT